MRFQIISEAEQIGGVVNRITAELENLKAACLLLLENKKQEIMDYQTFAEKLGDPVMLLNGAEVPKDEWMKCAQDELDKIESLLKKK